MEYIITALITGGLSLVGVIITNATNSKKIETRNPNWEITLKNPMLLML